MAISEDSYKLIVQAQNATKAVMQEVRSDLRAVRENTENVNSGFRSAGKTAGVFGGLTVVASNMAIRGLSKVKDTVIGITSAVSESSMQMEQTRVSFETFLGSADKAQIVLSKLTKFATKTPFNLPELQEASKRLLAYGLEANKLIPTLETLGNITAGVGRDKLGQLILAFGQVRAATYLTGAELRQFTEAGVPLLDELAKQSGKSAAQIKSDMEDGLKVPFEDVEKTLGAMTGEGGRFFNLMEKQSNTTAGVVSNLSDIFGILGRAVAGIDEQGNLKKGGLLDNAREILKQLYDAVVINKDGIIVFGEAIVNMIGSALEPFIGRIRDLDATNLRGTLNDWTNGINEFSLYVSVGANAVSVLWNAVKTGIIVTKGAARAMVDFSWVVNSAMRDAIQGVIPFGNSIGDISNALQALMNKDFAGAMNAVKNIKLFGFDFSGTNAAFSAMQSNASKSFGEITEAGNSTFDSIVDFSASIILLQQGVNNFLKTGVKPLEKELGDGGNGGLNGALKDTTKSTKELEDEQKKAEKRAKEFSDSFTTLYDKMKKAIKGFRDARGEARSQFKEERRQINEQIEDLRGQKTNNKNTMIAAVSDQIVEAQERLLEFKKEYNDLELTRTVEIEVKLNESIASINTQLEKTISTIIDDLNSSIVTSLINSEDKLASAQKELVESQNKAEKDLADLREKHIKELQGQTKTFIKSQIVMNRLTGEVLSSKQTTETSTELPNDINAIKQQQQEELEELKKTNESKFAEIQREIDKESSYLDKYKDYRTQLANDIATIRENSEDPILAAKREADSKIAESQRTSDAQIANAYAVAEAERQSLAAQLNEMQLNINKEQEFLNAHQQFIENNQSAIKDARVRSNRDAIDQIQVDFKVQQETLQQQILQLDKDLKTARDSRDQAIKDARKELRKEYKLMKEDAATLVADISDEFNKIPRNVDAAMKSLANKLEKAGLITNKKGKNVGDSTTNNNKTINITVNGNDISGGGGLEKLAVLLQLL